MPNFYYRTSYLSLGILLLALLSCVYPGMLYGQPYDPAVPKLIFTNGDYALYQFRDTPFRRFTSPDSDSLVIRGSHAIQHTYSYFVWHETLSDTVMAWSHTTTGQGEQPLWLGSDGQVITIWYSQVRIQTPNPTSYAAAPWEFTGFSQSRNCHRTHFEMMPNLPILSGYADYLFLLSKEENFKVYGISLAAAQAGDPKQKFPISGPLGEGYYDQRLLAHHRYCFSESKGWLWWFDWETHQMDSIDLRPWHPQITRSTAERPRLHYFHEQQLVYSIQQQFYLINIATRRQQKIDLDGAKYYDPRKNGGWRTDYPLPDSLQAVLHREAGALIQSDRGTLYFVPWEGKAFSMPDLSNLLRVSPYAGIDPELPHGQRRNILWQGDQIISIGASAIYVFDLATRQFHTFPAPHLNDAKMEVETIWNAGKTRVSTYHHYPPNWAEVFAVLLYSPDRLLLKTQAGFEVFHWKSGKRWQVGVRLDDF